LQAYGANYNVEYDSPMARMQRAERAAGYLRAWSVATDFAQKTGDNEPLDWFNHDIAIPAIMDIQGSPAAWQRSSDEVIARREARAQAQQQQQMIDAAPSIASVAKAAPELAKAAGAQGSPGAPV
jgi:hypothetical protein